MVTIYDLLEVEENASKEEIEKSYERLILEYHKNPNLTAKENEENELILNKLKIAYEILMNDEKRKKYDNDLAKKRAEELIKNVKVTNNKISQESIPTQNKAINSNNSQNTQRKENEDVNLVTNKEENQEVVLTKEEQEKVRKAAQEEFNQNLKKAQKAQEEYNQAYNQAYNEYLKKIGYNQKQPWTLKRVKNVVITIIVIILVCLLAWVIPPIRELLIGIYEDNIIVKSLVDIFFMLINAILSIFK